MRAACFTNPTEVALLAHLREEPSLNGSFSTMACSP